MGLKRKKRKPVDPRVISSLRARVCLTRAGFAEKLFVTRMTVWRWEEGKSRPSEVHLRQMRQMWGYQFGVIMKEDK